MNVIIIFAIALAKIPTFWLKSIFHSVNAVFVAFSLCFCYVRLIFWDDDEHRPIYWIMLHISVTSTRNLLACSAFVQRSMHLLQRSFFEFMLFSVIDDKKHTSYEVCTEYSSVSRRLWKFCVRIGNHIQIRRRTNNGKQKIFMSNSGGTMRYFLSSHIIESCFGHDFSRYCLRSVRFRWNSNEALASNSIHYFPCKRLWADRFLVSFSRSPPCTSTFFGLHFYQCRKGGRVDKGRVQYKF